MCSQVWVLSVTQVRNTEINEERKGFFHGKNNQITSMLKIDVEKR